MRALLHLTLFLLACSLLQADDDPKDFVLSKIDLFAFGPIGFAGTTSEGELALRELMAKPDRKTRLDALLKKGSPEAKCYAIAAYKLLDQKKHRELLQKFANDKTDVTIQGGCIRSDFHMKENIHRMKNGLHQAPKSLLTNPAA